MALWTAEEDERLKTLTAEGHSCSQIGVMMNRSRNSVIGRQHRIGLGGRGQPKHRKPRPRRQVNPVKRIGRGFGQVLLTPQILELRRLEAKMKFAAHMQEMDKGAQEPLMIPLLDLEPEHCRWPIGEVSDKNFGFCGHTRQEGSSYCPHHESRSRSGIPVREVQLPMPQRRAA